MNMIGRRLEYYSEEKVPAYVMMLGIRSAPDSMLAKVITYVKFKRQVAKQDFSFPGDNGQAG